MDSKDPNYQSPPNQDTPGSLLGTPPQEAAQTQPQQSPLEAQNNLHASDQPAMDDNAISAHDALKNQPATETAQPAQQPTSPELTALGNQPASPQDIQAAAPLQPQTPTEPAPETAPVSPDTTETPVPTTTPEMPIQQPTLQQNEQAQAPQPPGGPSDPSQPAQPPQGGGDQQDSDILSEINKERKMSKLPMIIGIAVLILAMIAAVAYYALNQATPTPSPTTLPTPIITAAPTSTPDPTANWEPYSNSEIGFTFDYPAVDGWEIFEDIQNSTALKSNREIWVAFPNSDQIVLTLYANESSLSAQNWWNDTGKQMFNQLVDDYVEVSDHSPETTRPSFQESQTKIGGKITLVVEGQVDSGRGSEDLIIRLVDNNGWVLMFVTQKNLYNDDLALTISDQILSTFQFTDSESTTSPSPSASPSTSPSPNSLNQ